MMERFRVMYFNSIKVQLKLCTLDGLSVSRSIFQFHKGTIKTSHLHHALCDVLANFNSIKVQLKHSMSLKSVALFIFQFHKGTIKTHCFWIYNILIFNRICKCKVKKSY